MRVICHTWGCAVSLKMSGCAARFCPACGNQNITILPGQEDFFFDPSDPETYKTPDQLWGEESQ